MCSGMMLEGAKWDAEQAMVVDRSGRDVHSITYNTFHPGRRSCDCADVVRVPDLQDGRPERCIVDDRYVHEFCGGRGAAHRRRPDTWVLAGVAALLNLTDCGEKMVSSLPRRRPVELSESPSR